MLLIDQKPDEAAKEAQEAVKLNSPIRKAAQGRIKGRINIVAYVLAIALALLWPYAAIAIYVAVAAMWLVPDKRFEALIGD